MPYRSSQVTAISCEYPTALQLLSKAFAKWDFTLYWKPRSLSDWKSCQASYGRFGLSVLHGQEFLCDCVQYWQSTRTALCQPQLPTRCSVAGFGDWALDWLSVSDAEMGSWSLIDFDLQMSACFLSRSGSLPVSKYCLGFRLYGLSCLVNAHSSRSYPSFQSLMTV